MSIDHGKALALAKKLAPLKAMPFEFDNGPAGDDQWCVCTKDSNLTGCDMDKEDAELFAYAVNALAQPAEAVESEVEQAELRRFQKNNTAFVSALPRKIDKTDAAPAEAVEGDETDPTALQIEYARGYGDGVKHGEQLRPTAAVSPEELRLYVSEQEACELERSHDAAQGAVAPFAYGADLTPGDYDMEHSVWLLRPGESVPAGCTPLYTHPQAAPALMSSQDDWTVLDCPHCGKCVTYSKKAASSKDAYRDLTQEVESLRERLGQAAPAQGDVEMAKIGRLIETQDNRITEAPIFIVQQKRQHVSHADYDNDGIVWVNDDNQEAGSEDHARLEAAFLSNFNDEPKGWRRLAVRTEWEFVTACFTEQGCKDYLARDGHNLKEPRIYAAGSYRNEEWRSVRKFLMSLAAAPSQEGE